MIIGTTTSTNTLACTEQQTNELSDAQLEHFLLKLYRSTIIDANEHNCKHCIDKLTEAFQISELEQL